MSPTNLTSVVLWNQLKLFLYIKITITYYGENQVNIKDLIDK